ncbi:MAG: hypothetical protein IKS32_08315 [Solobacterium sp.]|nr:hypothetical protein [Solobacterium sp.]
MSKKKHVFLKAVGAVAAAGTAAYGTYAWYLFTQAFNPRRSRFHPDGISQNSEEAAASNEWLKHSDRMDDTIRSYDDLTLHCMRIENHPDSNHWMIMMHGYHRCAYDLLPLMMEADKRGFNLLVPDQRASGQSEGNFSGLGWPEHYDLLAWINYLIALRPNAEIALYGIDMGASAVMNAVGDFVPSNVKCAVEEGGYIDMKEQLILCAEMEAGFNVRPFIPAVDLLVRQFLHFSMNDISTRRQLAESRTPMLFMHGSDDLIVPAINAERCHAAAGGEKALLLFRSTGFGGCRYNEAYADSIFSFIGKYIA